MITASFESMPDEVFDFDLHRWCEIYRANHMSIVIPGLTLQKFLQAPEQYVQAACFNKPLPLPEQKEFYPLLPKQQRIEKAIAFIDVYYDFEEELTKAKDCQHRDDHFIQRIRHHRYRDGKHRDNRRADR